MIERGIRQGAPQKFAWYAAFGLTVTLIWLYIEILRLLGYSTATSDRPAGRVRPRHGRVGDCPTRPFACLGDSPRRSPGLGAPADYRGAPVFPHG